MSSFLFDIFPRYPSYLKVTCGAFAVFVPYCSRDSKIPCIISLIIVFLKGFQLNFLRMFFMSDHGLSRNSYHHTRIFFLFYVQLSEISDPHLSLIEFYMCLF